MQSDYFERNGIAVRVIPELLQGTAQKIGNGVFGGEIEIGETATPNNRRIAHFLQVQLPQINIDAACRDELHTTAPGAVGVEGISDDNSVRHLTGLELGLAQISNSDDEVGALNLVNDIFNGNRRPKDDSIILASIIDDRINAITALEDIGVATNGGIDRIVSVPAQEDVIFDLKITGRKPTVNRIVSGFSGENVC